MLSLKVLVFVISASVSLLFEHIVGLRAFQVKTDASFQEPNLIAHAEAFYQNKVARTSSNS